MYYKVSKLIIGNLDLESVCEEQDLLPHPQSGLRKSVSLRALATGPSAQQRRTNGSLDLFRRCFLLAFTCSLCFAGSVDEDCVVNIMYLLLFVGGAS